MGFKVKGASQQATRVDLRDQTALFNLDEFMPNAILNGPDFVGEPIHSSRSNIAGSMDSARCAGIQVAKSPNSAMAITTPASTSGSREVA